MNISEITKRIEDALKWRKEDFVVIERVNNISILSKEKPVVRISIIEDGQLPTFTYSIESLDIIDKPFDEFNKMLNDILKSLNLSTYLSETEVWVYWCLNYDDTERMIKEIVDRQENFEHYKEKFDFFYKQRGSDGCMNAFFCYCTLTERERLRKYVLNWAEKN